MNTSALVQLPSGQKAVNTKWMFDLKRDGEGLIVRHKAWLEGIGFTKSKGVDFQKVYFSVSRYATVRLALSVSVNQNHKCQICVCKCPNQITVYTVQPGGFMRVCHEEWVYILRKKLYRLQ